MDSELVEGIAETLKQVEQRGDLVAALYEGLLGNKEDGANPGRFGKGTVRQEAYYGTGDGGGKMNGSQAVVATLKEYGVKHLFGLPGDTSIGFYEALYDARDEITHVLTRDERSAAFMTDVYARVSYRPGVCEAPSGAGALCLAAGIAEAHASSIPVIALTTDTPLAQRGRTSSPPWTRRRSLPPLPNGEPWSNMPIGSRT